MELPRQPGTSTSQPALRVGDQDRDAVASLLQASFAEGRLSDEEFDTRTRAALTARTSDDLDRLHADLPRPSAAPAAPGSGGPAPGRLALAYKGPVRRAGRWRVPERFSTVVYKGTGALDLRAAELPGPHTMIRAVAYKSRIDIWVPPGMRVELTGWAEPGLSPDEWERMLPPDAPVLHVRVAYKGAIEISTRPNQHQPVLPASRWQNRWPDCCTGPRCRPALRPTARSGTGRRGPVVMSPQRASSRSRSSGAIIAPDAVSRSHSVAGTRHMTSNSMPFGSLAYSDLDTRWSLAPTSAPRSASRALASASSLSVPTSQARWYRPTAGPSGGPAASGTANRPRSWSLAVPGARRNAIRPGISLATSKPSVAR